MRPVFILERCLAIRFERIPAVPAAVSSVVSAKNKSSADSRPGSSLSQQFSTWLPWQRHHQQSHKQPEAPVPPPPPVINDAPAVENTGNVFIPLVKNPPPPAELVCDCVPLVPPFPFTPPVPPPCAFPPFCESKPGYP